MATTNKTKKQLTLKTAVSWGGTIVLLGIAAKVLHYSWAENFIAGALCVEALVFFIMGFDGMNADNQEDLNQGGGIHPDHVDKLTHAIESINETSKASILVMNTLVNDLGIKNLAESLTNAKDLTSIDTTTIQKQIKETAIHLSDFNTSLSALSKIYAAQVSAFKSN